MQYFERGKKEFVKRLTHTCICVMMHRYSCSKLQLHWYVCIASALVYPLSLPTAQCSPASAQTADMQPMWTCNCFARAIQSALLHSVYFWLLGCLQLLPVLYTRVVFKEWVNTVERFWGYCQWGSLALLKVALIGNIASTLVYTLLLLKAECSPDMPKQLACSRCGLVTVLRAPY